MDLLNNLYEIRDYFLKMQPMEGEKGYIELVLLDETIDILEKRMK